MRKKNDQISSLIFALFGLAISYGAYALELGEVRNPGPGFLPFWAGIILSSISLGVFIGATRRKSEKKEEPREIWANIRWENLLLVLIAMVAYANTFEILGFVLGTLALMAVLFKLEESSKWSVSIGGSLLTVVLTYLLFERVFQSGFPRGILGF